MDLIKKYGRHAAIGLIVLGIASLFLAFIISPAKANAQVWVEGEERPINVAVNNMIIGNWLLSAGIRIFPGDAVFFSGLEVPPSFTIPEEGSRLIYYRNSFPVALMKDGISYSFSSSSLTLGDALWQQGIAVKPGDDISLPLETPLDQPLEVTLYTGKQVKINIGTDTFETYSAAQTISGALRNAGIPLQDLDYTIPAESGPLPAEGFIEVIRVSEETLIEESVIAYTSERLPDPELAIGEKKVLQTGQNGIRISSIRVRFENGKEVSRETETEWISKQPISQKTAYGTQVVVQTSPEGLNYWLTKDIYITSYLDTGNPTASGIWPYYGVIAVSPEWYSILKGTSIFVPGYGVGTVLDVCPGCVGKPWIDVFIPTEDYVPWSRNETVYFLAPVPPGFSGDLP